MQFAICDPLAKGLLDERRSKFGDVESLRCPLFNKGCRPYNITCSASGIAFTLHVQTEMLLL